MDVHQSHAGRSDSADTPPLLKVSSLVLARESKPFARVPDFNVAAGQSVAIVGKSGSGKTTALMAIAAIRAPGSGAITIEGIDPWTLPLSARDQFRSHFVGLVFQSFHLIDALSVAANIRLPARWASNLVDSRIAARLPDHAFNEKERLEMLLEKLGIAEIAGRRADRISHGQAQRVAVARALFNQPSVIVADEPTSALDDANAAGLLDLLKASAASEGAALVIASHDARVIGEIDNVVRMETL